MALNKSARESTPGTTDDVIADFPILLLLK